MERGIGIKPGGCKRAVDMMSKVLEVVSSWFRARLLLTPPHLLRRATTASLCLDLPLLALHAASGIIPVRQALFAGFRISRSDRTDLVAV